MLQAINGAWSMQSEGERDHRAFGIHHREKRRLGIQPWRREEDSMAFTSDYVAQEPTRSDIDALPGDTLLEFGAPWCGYCMAVQPLLANAMAGRADLRHIKVEDGKGQPLGRSFRIKLWPTLVVLRDGEELARVVRPSGTEEIERALSVLG